MSDARNDAANQGDADQAPPALNCLTQYVKDLSFENPNAPQSLAQTSGEPDMNVEFDVEVQRMGENVFEVAFRLSVKAQSGETVFFVVDLTYAGLFQLVNIPEENWHPICLIECPRQLFPFARQIVSTLTTQGGYPPVLLRPIDFSELYARNLARAQEMQAQGNA